MCGPYLWTSKAGLVVVVVGVAAYVRPFVDDQHSLVRASRQPFGDDSPGEPGPDDEVVEHGGVPSWHHAVTVHRSGGRCRRSRSLVIPARRASTRRLRCNTSSTSRHICPHVESHDISDRNTSAADCADRPRAPRGLTQPPRQSGRRCRRCARAPVRHTGARRRGSTWTRPAFPAARYSGVFVGLMNRVDSLRANGSHATSHPAM